MDNTGSSGPCTGVEQCRYVAAIIQYIARQISQPVEVALAKAVELVGATGPVNEQKVNVQ